MTDQTAALEKNRITRKAVGTQGGFSPDTVVFIPALLFGRSFSSPAFSAQPSPRTNTVNETITTIIISSSSSNVMHGARWSLTTPLCAAM